MLEFRLQPGATRLKAELQLAVWCAINPADFQALVDLARQADEEPRWPEASWDVARRIGATGWSLPRKFGGAEIAGTELLSRYEELAAACLTTCFILSQRDAACRRLLGSGNGALCDELLPALATGEQFMTVGLAQLTTSRQHVKAPVTATRRGDDWLIDGVIPWVTGAARAEHIVIGAVTDGNQQILAVLPTELEGVTVEPPLELAALESSITAEVRCANVLLPAKWLLAGPAANVLTGPRGGTGGLETSCLALGLALAALRFIQEQATLRPELRPLAQRLAEDHAELRRELHRLATSPAAAQHAQTLRARANAFVLRITQSALAASKGTGFLRQHPAQRWARQALFFLVWSCPWPVTEATIVDLIGGPEGECPWSG